MDACIRRPFSFLNPGPMTDQTNPVNEVRAPNATRLPAWIRVRLGHDAQFARTSAVIDGQRLNTVCEEACCPNRGECWSRGTATFMLLGDTCTRACAFCSVKTGRPDWFDADEPRRVAQAVVQMGLKYVVLTSVNRDDLADGGAEIFAETLRALRTHDPDIGVEFLTPDFQHKQAEAVTIVSAALDAVTPAPAARTRLVWGHNVETVPRLYRTARKGAKYETSLELLARAALIPGVETKSAIMLGLGETRQEVMQVLHDLRAHSVARLSLGQYLRPSADNLPVAEYIHPDQFAELEAAAKTLGFSWVKAGPLVRSSYHAEEEQPAA
jgi:lipoic acid synthetase